MGEGCRRRVGSNRNRRRHRVLIITGRQKRDGAFMVYGRVAMNLLMEERNRRKNDREKNRADATSRDKRTEGYFAIGEAQAHFVGEFASVGGSAQVSSVAAPLRARLVGNATGVTTAEGEWQESE